MPEQVYTREQRIAAMRAAGWPEYAIPVGVAVSLAESWNGKGINNNPPVEYSVGPWQINLLAHHNITEEQAQDLNYSTAYALRLWQSQGFNPWGAFTNGSYLKFLPETVTPAPEPKDTPPSATGIVGKGATTTGVITNPLSFSFPTLALGPFKTDTNPLFKIALSVGALFLLFKGLVVATE